MRGIVLVTVSFFISGCAASVAGLGESEIYTAFESSRSAQQVAGCLALELKGSNPLVEVDEGHFIVTRSNIYGPVARWDIFQIDSGSRLELRSSIDIGSGVDKARACAGLDPN